MLKNRGRCAQKTDRKGFFCVVLPFCLRSRVQTGDDFIVGASPGMLLAAR
jgi:hypothetical protein